MTRRAFPLVLAAPSGSGKTTLARALVERRSDITFSLSATTRGPRPGERDGVDYMFVDDAGFDRLIESGALFEWAWVHGRRYGTLRSGVESAMRQGSIVVLDIDVQGARRVRDTVPEAVLIFVLPPSVAEMVRRLHLRGSEDTAELATRMRTARSELDEVADFDYVVINDDFERALSDIEMIIAAQPLSAENERDVDGLLETLRADIDEILERST